MAEMIRFRLCRFNEKTGRWHATAEEWVRPAETGELPPTVQEMLEIGLPDIRCVEGMSVWAPEAPRVGASKSC